MCGIAGIFGPNSNEEAIKDSLEKIKHRGTDLFEIKTFPHASLGANRLPIVDRAHGQQPLANEDNTVFAVQNGEIFNYKALQADLTKKGHVFKTKSDTETLVHLYEEYGEKLVDHLDSEMFAFLVYDVKRNVFIAGRDRFGVKPLYFAEDAEGSFHFASELKQLTNIEEIKQIKIFPPAHIMRNGKLTRYYQASSNNDITDAAEAKRQLTTLIVEAVRKRVDTDLPIAVLLSGGVDSSLIMEIANRLHPDVTAFILGSPGSPDYEAAVNLCKQYQYKHQIITPDVNYSETVDGIIYHLELYEAQVIRQSFALDVLSKAVVRAGYRVALAGDASDEIFGGYNEFISLQNEKINEGCAKLLSDLSRGHNQRLDRLSMKHTLEVRAPFFDTEVVDYALKIAGNLKIHRDNHRVTTKYILRAVASEFLPPEIAWRYKVPFSNGAGMNVGFNFRSEDGEVALAVQEKEKIPLEQAVMEKYGFLTHEEQYYFQKYRQYGYAKLSDNWLRIITKDNLRDVDSAPRPRMLVAEFDKLPIYYPIYHAARKNLYNKHGLDIDFISTGGDDLTYNSLLNNSAQIGLADPVFSYSENKMGMKGKIIGELIGKVPLKAVSIRPDIAIDKLASFNEFKIGTFQKFTTTHTIAKYLLPNANIIAYDYKKLLPALQNKAIDIAITIPEFAEEVVSRGGHVVYDFEPEFKYFLLSGFTIADNLDKKYLENIESYLAAVKEAIKDIRNQPAQSLESFTKEFPGLTNHKHLFDYLLTLWTDSLKVHKSGLNKSRHVWKTVYPWLLKTSLPRFVESGPEEPIVKLITSKRFSRDIPYREDELRRKLRQALRNKQPIQMVGFWGASGKKEVDLADLEAIEQLVTFNEEIKSLHKQGAKMTLILSDEHARLNSFKAASYRPYLQEIEAILQKSGIATIPLSRLWRKWRLRPDIIQARIRQYERQKKTWWNDVIIRSKLEESAQKTIGTKKYKEEAKRYYVMRSIESQHLKREFPEGIFITYASDEQQVIFPDIATLYLWVKKGTSHVPWFSSQKQPINS